VSTQPLQDRLVWEYFDCKIDGFFVEVGANHPTNGSQTWLLEQNGWRGVLIEPQVAHCRLLREVRKCSQVFQVACTSPQKEGETLLYLPRAELNGFTTTERNVDDPGIIYERTERVKAMTLDHVLAEAALPRLDFISIDVEGTELDVLKGFDLARHRPALILIEDKCQSLHKHRHLTARGYKLVKRTELNNWYVPAEVHFTKTTPREKVELFRKIFLGLPFRKFRRFRRKLRA